MSSHRARYVSLKTTDAGRKELLAHRTRDCRVRMDHQEGMIHGGVVAVPSHHPNRPLRHR